MREIGLKLYICDAKGFISLGRVRRREKGELKIKG